MFSVNDYVVYGLMGVCQIEHIRKDEYNCNDETEYYVLHPIDNNNITIMTPVKKPNVVMRAVSTRDDVLSLIAAMPTMETVWIDDDKQRNNNYKTALKTGKTEDWAKIMKTLYLEKEARAAAGKKLSKTDEEIFNTAEKHLNQEIAIALDIGPDEVIPYILDNIH